jgi:hypothetical protein
MGKIIRHMPPTTRAVMQKPFPYQKVPADAGTLILWQTSLSTISIPQKSPKSRRCAGFNTRGSLVGVDEVEKRALGLRNEVVEKIYPDAFDKATIVSEK